MSLTGNASSLHTSGRAARRRVEESRESIAAALGARPSEVLFTSGGTESDNLAVAGIFRARRAADPARRRIIAAALEHHAVLDVVDFLVATEGAVVSWLEVDDFGRVHADTLAAAIAENPSDVAVISVMWANNEVGTVNPIRELADVAHAHGIPFHTDAVQALGQLPVDFARCGADALTVTGHKVGGPTGDGLLLLRREIVGGAAAARRWPGARRPVRDAGRRRHRRPRRRRAGRRHPSRGAGRRCWPGCATALIAAVTARIPDAVLSGDPGQSLVDGAPSRLPGNAHLRFPGCEGDSLLMLLDANGIECSTGSACTAGVARPSHVLLAMGVWTSRRPAGRCGSPSVTPRPPPTCRRWTRRIGPVVERARRAAAGRGATAMT